MSSPASLITSIDSVLKNTTLESGSREARRMKIGLKTLKIFLILCLREMDEDDDTHLMKCSSNQASLFVRIEDVIARLISLLEKNVPYSNIVKEVHNLGNELDDVLLKSMRPTSSPLHVDKILQIADSIQENTDDLLTLTRFRPTAYEVIYAFEVHTRFMKSFLPFVEGTGVELQPLLFHIQPIVFNAARVFTKYGNHTKWHKVIGAECSMVNRMATDPHIYQAYTQALTTSKLFLSRSQDNPLDGNIIKNFLSSLISLLWDVLRHSYLKSTSKHQFKVLYERLRSSRAVLKNFKDEKIKCQVGVLICDAGVLISSLRQIDTRKLSDLLQRFDDFQGQVELETNPSKATEELSSGDFTQIKISDDGSGKQLEYPTPILSHQLSLHDTPQVVGFQHDEFTSVFDRLTRGSRQLHLVPIVGMGGLGKTTFALKLYKHSSVTHHFQVCAWCTISQVLDKKKVLLELLDQIQPRKHRGELTEDDLAVKLYQSLKGKRYLIFLDDVWTPQVWDDLKASFPDDSTHSRVIITSRRLDIAPDDDPHLLRLRQDSECLEILEVRLLHTEGWNHEFGMEIAKVCKGLPLTTVIVAGLLSTKEQQGWKAILDDLSLSSSVPGVERTLNLSYKYLPDHLHRCYLYLGAFPEDRAIPVTYLIRLWMAEGFVQKEELKGIEDVAREYLDELIGRSLVMVSGTRSIGGAKTCQMHDLLRDFCQVKSKQENLFHLLEQRRDELSDFNEPCGLERLVIHSDPSPFKESRLFCPRAQSMLLSSWKTQKNPEVFDMTFIIQIFKHLKVLDIRQIKWTNEIPSEIRLLTQLRFLSISSNVPVIPSSIGMLYNLVTFIVYINGTQRGSFPHTLWNLRNLRHLCVNGNGLTLPIGDVEIFPSLIDLEGIVFRSNDENMEKLLRKAPNIRKLKCRIVSSIMEESHNIVIPECSSRLESLSICGEGKLKCEFGSTGCLRKLKLKGFELSREVIAVIGKLPNLEVLKLQVINYPGNALEMEEEEFLKLRILELRDSFYVKALERWTASDDQLPCLQKLEFWGCKVLKELPSCLESSSTLVEIKVNYCSSTLKSAVIDIVEGHKDYGNSVELHIIS